jgi:hypothetical protein
MKAFSVRGASRPRIHLKRLVKASAGIRTVPVSSSGTFSHCTQPPLDINTPPKDTSKLQSSAGILTPSSMPHSLLPISPGSPPPGHPLSPAHPPSPALPPFPAHPPSHPPSSPPSPHNKSSPPLPPPSPP